MSINNTILESIATLRTYNLNNSTCLLSAELLGYYVSGDGGGGFFYWDVSSVATINNPPSGYSIGNGIVMNVNAIPESLAIGTILEFTGGGIFTLTADANSGALSITGDLTISNVSNSEESFYPDNGGSIIEPIYQGYNKAGRWKRPEKSFYDIREFGAVGDNSTDNSLILTTANGQDYRLIISNGDYVINSNVNITVPEVEFTSRAKLVISSSITVDFSQETNIIAGNYQIFDGDGVVDVKSSVSALPQWWGAVGIKGAWSGNKTVIANASDDTTALQKCFDQADSIYFNDNFVFTQKLTIPEFKTIKGRSRRGYGLIAYGANTLAWTDNICIETGSYPLNYWTCENMMFSFVDVNDTNVTAARFGLYETSIVKDLSFDGADCNLATWLEMSGGPSIVENVNIGYESGFTFSDHWLKLGSITRTGATKYHNWNISTEATLAKGILVSGSGQTVLDTFFIETPPNSPAASVVMKPDTGGVRLSNGTLTTGKADPVEALAIELLMSSTGQWEIENVIVGKAISGTKGFDDILRVVDTNDITVRTYSSTDFTGVNEKNLIIINKLNRDTVSLGNLSRFGGHRFQYSGFLNADLANGNSLETVHPPHFKDLSNNDFSSASIAVRVVGRPGTPQPTAISAYAVIDCNIYTSTFKSTTNYIYGSGNFTIDVNTTSGRVRITNSSGLTLTDIVYSIDYLGTNFLDGMEGE